MIYVYIYTYVDYIISINDICLYMYTYVDYIISINDICLYIYICRLYNIY